MPTSGADARRRSYHNKRLPCSVQGCPRRRRMVAAHCSDHARRLQYFGHTEGHAIQKQQLALFVKVAHRTLKKLEDHSAVVTALDIMRSLITPPSLPI